MEGKYKIWMITILQDKKDLPESPAVISALVSLGDDWVFQKELHENSDTEKYHYQCCLTTKIRQRQKTLLKQLGEELNHPIARIRVERALGSWEQCKEYCSKEETRSGDTVRAPKSVLLYKGHDIDFLADESRRYPWQSSLLNKVFDEIPNTIKDPDDRTIIWITDSQGNTGKSKLVKYCCFFNNNIAKISFGSASQLRSGIIATGQKQIYIIDMPRTLGDDDSLNSVLSAIEDLKNGFLVSHFYGASNKLIMDPPHIIIFSNMACPFDKLSSDRWKYYTIYNKELRGNGE